MYSVNQFQLFLSNVYLRKPTVTILHLSSVWFITKIVMQWFPSSVAIQPVLFMALQSKVLYCAFCTPVGNLRMYSLLLTRCCVNQLGGLSHTQLVRCPVSVSNAVGEGFRLYIVWLNQLLLRVQKPLSHYTDCQTWCPKHYVFASRRVLYDYEAF